MNKSIRNWSNRDLLNWVKTIGLSAVWEKNMVESITSTGCTGKDWFSVNNNKELAKKFNIKQPMLANRVFREFKKIKQQQNNTPHLQQSIESSIQPFVSYNNSQKNSFKVGEKVMAQENGKFYNASIEEVHPNFGVLIKWDEWPDPKHDLWIMTDEYNTKIRTKGQTTVSNKRNIAAKAHQFKVGQTVKCVDTRYNNNGAYLATIKRVEQNRIYVHYIDYSDQHDQWIPKNEWKRRITIAIGKNNSHNKSNQIQASKNKKADNVKFGTSSNASTQFTVGQPVFCTDINDNKWYHAKIKQVRENKVLVQWENPQWRDAKFDQWVTSSNYVARIRLKNSNNHKPAHSFKVGQEIKCIDTRYKDNKAYDAVITAIEANRVFVLYKGYAESAGQWINRTEFVSRIISRAVNNYRYNSSKADESIIMQLQAFGYTREQILAGMRAVTNPRDINEIVEWLEKRLHHSPANNNNNSHQQQNKAVVPYKAQPKQNNDDDAKEEMAFLQFLGGLVSLKVVEDYGFGMASEQNRIKLLYGLKNVQCCRGTALRDAVLTGIVMLLKLKAALVKLDVIKHKFVHIVLTDGEDTASDSSLNEVKGFFHKLGDELGDLCKTFFIGVGLGNAARGQLASIANLGGDACDLYNCEDVELDKVFARIKIELGLVTEVLGVKVGNKAVFAAQKKLIANISEQNFLVLFTLDKSGSMAGGRWNKVVRAVAGFCIGMKDHDILGCILFNDKATLLNIF